VLGSRQENSGFREKQRKRSSGYIGLPNIIDPCVYGVEDPCEDLRALAPIDARESTHVDAHLRSNS
jgi:hypothetical protein